MSVRHNYVTDPASVNGWLSGWGTGVVRTLETATPLGMPAGFDHCTKIVHSSGAWQEHLLVEKFTVAPGETYTLNLWLASSGMAGDSFNVDFKTSLGAGSTLRTVDIAGVVANRPWSRLAFLNPITIASGENTLLVRIYVGNGTGTYYGTGAILEKAASHGTYFDGSYPYSAWVSAANASASINIMGDEAVTIEATAVTVEALAADVAALAATVEAVSSAVWANPHRALTDKQGFALAAPASLLRLDGNPTAIRYPVQPAASGDISTTDYTNLYNDRVNPGLTAMFGSDWRDADTDTVAFRVLRWLTAYLGREGILDPNPPWSLASLLAWHDAGNSGDCGYYSNVLCHVFACLGIPARIAGWGDDVTGDTVVEYYSPELRQWVLLGAISNTRFHEGVDGPLLNLLQLHQMADLSGVSFDAEMRYLTQGMLPSLAGSVSWCVEQMGAAPPDISGWVQMGDNLFPLPFWSETKFATVSADIANFDVNLVQFGVLTLDGATLTVPVADSYVAWPVTYTATAYSDADAVLATTTWTNGDGSINVTGADYVTVYAENSRGGWSNSVTIADLMGAVATDAKLSDVLLKTNTIGAHPVTVTSPVAASGTITLSANDDYHTAHGRSIPFDIDDPTHALGLDDPAASVELRCSQATWTANAVETTDGYHVDFEIPHAGLTRSGHYQLKCLLADGDVVTRAKGEIVLERDIAVVPEA